MNPNLTEIAYILDRSGSMQSMQEPAVAAFNQFVKSQLDVPGEARLTLVLFDDQYETPLVSTPVEQVGQLTAATYVPRGSTALLDAIGRTIQETAARIDAQPEEARPGKVILTIFTDGLENASRHYTNAHISDLIALHRAKGWEFLFLAANQDAITTAATISLDQHGSSNVADTAQSYAASGSAMARKVRAFRMKASGHMDADALADDAKSMSEILKEEESK